MKLFITGGAGFIGSALLQAALKGGHSITVFDNFSRGRREYCPADPRLEVVEGDIRDRRRVREAISSDRPDAIIHLAGLHFIPDCIKRPQECLQINVDGTGNVLSAAAAVGVKRFVFASTAAVYAPTADACVEKSTPLDPAEVYGQSKILGELLSRGHHDRTRTAVTLLRLFNAIGPRETNPHILPHIFETLRTTDVLPLGNTHPKRDYIDTRDISSAILAVLKRPRGLGVYNVGTGTAYSVSDLVDLLRDKLKRPIRIETDQARLRPVDRPMLLSDPSKLRKDTDWTARTSMSESLDELIGYYGLK